MPLISTVDVKMNQYTQLSEITKSLSSPRKLRSPRVKRRLTICEVPVTRGSDINEESKSRNSKQIPNFWTPKINSSFEGGDASITSSRSESKQTNRRRRRSTNKALSKTWNTRCSEKSSEIDPTPGVQINLSAEDFESSFEEFFREEKSSTDNPGLEFNSEIIQLDTELFRLAQLEDRKSTTSRGDNNSTSSPPGTKKPPQVQIGEYSIQAFYVSPYCFSYEDYETIYICEHCMKCFISQVLFNLHYDKTNKKRCTSWHPPGNEIYRKDSISVFEVDGEKARAYCVSVCLLSKLFLWDKVLCFDVEPFLFYILLEHSSTGLHFVGYFSKPKEQGELNLSCLMVLPPFQRMGYGGFLIDFSYQLSKKERTWGTPDKPLSSFGKKAYESYWKSILLGYFYRRKDLLLPVTIDEIRSETGIKAEDILETLGKLKFLRRLKVQSSKLNETSRIRPGPMMCETLENHRFCLCIDWKLVEDSNLRRLQKPTITFDEAALKIRVDLHRKYSNIFGTLEEVEEEELQSFIKMDFKVPESEISSSQNTCISKEKVLSSNEILKTDQAPSESSHEPLLLKPKHSTEELSPEVEQNIVLDPTLLTEIVVRVEAFVSSSKNLEFSNEVSETKDLNSSSLVIATITKQAPDTLESSQSGSAMEIENQDSNSTSNFLVSSSNLESACVQEDNSSSVSTMWRGCTALVPYDFFKCHLLTS